MTKKKEELKKKKWARPKLIVLTRGTPGEYSLMGCKVNESDFGGPYDIAGSCFGDETWCADCFVNAVS
jgi:hypothetical protein